MSLFALRNTRYSIRISNMSQVKNIFLKIEYVGTKYHGWQTQKKSPKTATIQQTIETVLAKILQQKIKLIASGRTDAGVHAKGQCANFKAESKMPLKKLQTAVNSLLPGDIRVKAIKYVKEDFHCRYHAKSKVYRYLIINDAHGSAFLRETAMQFHKKLNIRLMQKEAFILKGRHDFKSFQAADKKEKSSKRTIKNISVKKQGKLIAIDIEADGFLYNMVRNIVGTLLEIGRGKIAPGAMKEILKQRDRKSAGPTAPAKGLCLLKVNY